MNKLAFYPDVTTDGNHYIDHIKNALREAFPDIELVSLAPIRSTITEIDGVWLNWFESLYAKDTLSVTKEVLRKAGALLLLKLFRKKIITVMHNRMPHEVKYHSICRRLFQMTLRAADNIVILSDDSRQVVNEIAGADMTSKIIKVPHPLYHCRLKKYGARPCERPTVTFFGLIRPYQNIELILSLAARFPDIRFIIAGKVFTPDYQTEISDKAGAISNVSFRPGHLDDDAVNSLFDESDALILPYDMTSSLNSGVVYYACSAGINVIIPEIATVNEFANRDMFFHYAYASPEDHLEKLTDIMTALNYEYHNDFSSFVSRAETLRNEALHNNSREVLVSHIRQIKL